MAAELTCLPSGTTIAAKVTAKIEARVMVPPRPQPQNGEHVQMQMSAAVKTCLAKYADFEGRASRPEYWWFLLVVLLGSAITSLISVRIYTLFTLVTLIPLLAVGARRLHDTNRSGWWQLLALVPFGVVIPMILLAQVGKEAQPQFWDRPA